MSVSEDRSDEVLVETLRQAPEGDTRAFETLVRRHQTRVVTNCRYMTRSPDDAEDLAQEVFAKAYYGLGRFEKRSLFKTWLERIKINHCLNFLQKKKGKTFVELDTTRPEQTEKLKVEPVAPRKLKAESERALIGEILDQMPDTLRLPLLMRDLDGLTYGAIAEELQIGLSAVKMRIKRGREEFRRLWDETHES